MKRRSFFGALLAGAAAFVVAPAVKAEGTVPKTHAHFAGDGCPSDAQEIAEHDEIRARVNAILSDPENHPILMARVRELTAEARAEGYERGRAVEAARQESRALDSAPLFDREGVAGWVTRETGPALTFQSTGVWVPAGKIADLEITTGGVRRLDAMWSQESRRAQEWRASLT